MNLKERAKMLKIEIPTIFLSLKDKETPKTAKILGFATIAYALSPIDLIPDFIPVLGYLDDLIILPILISLTLRFIPKSVYERNREVAKDLWVDGKPKKWFYAIPIIVIWVLIILYFIKVLFY